MPSEKSYQRFDHDAYAKTRPADDFWGQVRRTVCGVPVSDDQIKMIVDAIQAALELNPSDTLLDIACGNGALSHLLFGSCADFLGVDLSEHLIAVAKKNFEALPHYQFVRQGAAEYVRRERQPERFTKVLCYGSFSYFPADDAMVVLKTLFDKFINVQTVFIGNLPDKDRMTDFYKMNRPSDEELLDCKSQIGIWRSRNEFMQLAENAGWTTKLSSMRKEFYASHYRYDAILVRSS